jgi:hypothetical protein
VIFTLKSKFALFRHSEVLRVRREMKRKEKEWAVERQQLIDAALTSRGGKPAFKDSPPPRGMSVEGQYTPPGSASRRPVAALAPEEMNQLDQFKTQEVNG